MKTKDKNCRKLYIFNNAGNHSVQGDWLNEIDKTNGLMVYHYPIRSYKQFYSKVNNGGSGYKINKELPIGNGFHKRYWYDLLLKGKLEDLYYKSYEYNSKRLRKGIKNKDIIEDHRIEAIFERKKKVN